LNNTKYDLKKIARKVVRDCLMIKPDEYFRIDANDPIAYDFCEMLAIEAIEVGGRPFIMVSSDNITRKIMEQDIEYIKRPGKLSIPLTEVTDVHLLVTCQRDPWVLKNVDPAKISAASVAGVPGRDYMINKNKEKKFSYRKSSFIFPTKEEAKKYNLPFEEYEELVWKAMDIDYSALSKRARKIANLLKQGKRVHITTNDGTDISFDINGRPILIDDGVFDEFDANENFYLQNLPTGEVYLAPIEETANGTAIFQYNFFFGKPVKNLKLTFENGKVVKSDADEGLEHFNAVLKNNSGDKDIIGELGIGLNPVIREIVGEAALDEKIIGTIHIAIGENRMFEGKNRSSLHQDLIMKSPTLLIDGKPIMENGEYVI
jgi:aminopeptidase